MPKGVKGNAYLRFRKGKMELDDFTFNELKEIIAGLGAEITALHGKKKSEVKVVEVVKHIKLDEESYDFLQKVFVKKESRKKD